MDPRDEAQAAFRAACAHDRNGRESDAIPEYERALELGLCAEDRRCALIGLGSSLRNVDRAHDAIAILTKAIVEFPNDAALPAFLALAFYAAGEPRSAMMQLLDVAIRHSPVGRYARALAAYRDTLP